MNTEQKKARKVRGYATFSTDSEGREKFTFQEQGEGRPSQRDKKTRGKSSFYRTDGEKEASIVAHLRVDAQSEDPVAQLYDDLDKLTRDMRKDKPQAPRGKSLLDRDDLKVYFETDKREISTLITIKAEEKADTEKKLYLIFGDFLKCLAINRTSVYKQK